MTENTGYIIVVIPYTIYHFYTGTITQTTVYISGLQCLQGGAYLYHMYYEEKCIKTNLKIQGNRCE